MKSWQGILALVSAGEGVLLAAGLEACFGVGRYTLIMELGALGGLGIGILVWLARGAWMRSGASRRDLGRLVLASAVPGLVVFAIAFAWRILPLIREELKYNL
jgi:hypothetical protein